MKKHFAKAAFAVAMIFCLSVCVTAFADTANVQNKITFTDVDTQSEQGQAIYKLANAGIVSGNGDGTFTPNGSLTRAELCKMINLVFKYTENASEQFADVTADDWFAPYVLVAKKAGYITGYEDGTFRGNNNITREEFCAILTRVNPLYDLGLSANITDEVSDWAKGYVNLVVTGGLMSVEDGGKFRATENMKRSEIAVVLAKFVQAQQPSQGGSVIGGGSSSGGSSSGGSSSGGSSSGGSSSGGSSSGGSSSGGSSSGGSSSGNKDNTGDNDDKDRETIDKENEKVVNGMKTVYDQLNTQKKTFRGTPLKIVNIILETVNSTIADADSGKLITNDYVKKTYQDKVDEAKALYDSMPEGDQNSFKSELAKIDPDAVEYLYTYFF